MSPRITRSAARLSAGSSSANTNQSATLPVAPVPSRPPVSTRKRKAAPRASLKSPDLDPELGEDSSRRRTKRTKVEVTEPPPPPTPAPPSRRRKGKGAAAMSNTGSSAGPSEEINPTQTTPLTSSSKPKTNRKKPSQETPASAITTPPNRRTKRPHTRADDDVAMTDARDAGRQADNAAEGDGRLDTGDGSNGEGASHRYEEDDDDDDPYETSYLGRPGGHLGLSSTIRALSGMMSGVTSRLRGILENLRQKDEPSVQLIALQELSEILLVSTEDNLAGHFSPDQYVKELVSLMQPNDFGEENPEIMLLACRCIANMMEALPSSTASVVYNGAVPVLCQKLLEIHFIDLAEQALSTLEKISVEFPASIVREGGLTACLTYLDFFATGTQRTAVTTAANCCRNIPEDSFPVVRDVMPILLNVLNSSDQKVVEQGCLCVSRIIESFKYQESKLEELVSTDLLKAILRLLLPGSTNLIGPNIHTQFLRVLGITARASPRLSAELLKMKVVDTIYQILTGVSPPSGTEDIATKIDSVVIMQALIHRPREQIYETLNVICELLPNVPKDGLTFIDDMLDSGAFGDTYLSMSARSRTSSNDTRLQLLEGCKEEVKRFAVILLPTLTDAYSSTVNLSVRQKVLIAHLKMLSNLDVDILEEALRTVPYASFLASILSQQDHAALVTFALQAAELLLKRLEPIYRYQFYREGVISEISKLASRPCKSVEAKRKGSRTGTDVDAAVTGSQETNSSVDDIEIEDMEEVHDDDDDEGSEDDKDEDDGNHENDDDGSDSASSSSSEEDYTSALALADVDDIITMRAKKFMETHENDKGKDMRLKAAAILDDLKSLAQDIKSCYLENERKRNGTEVFSRLAEYFEGDALESITSYELLTSNIVHVLLDVFSDTSSYRNTEARSAFLQAFMNGGTQQTPGNSPHVSPFSVLVHKLQDLLSRSEHFEVITVHQNTFDSNRSSAASLLAKQIRIKLVADEDPAIPRGLRNINVNIHAIATFKALDDYLRPRISLMERPRGSRHREGGVSSAIAAYAAALASRGDPERRSALLPPVVPTPSDLTNRTIPKRSAKTKTPSATSSTQPGSSSVPEKPSGIRRSSRRHQSQSQSQSQGDPPPPPHSPRPLENQEPLECADEAHISDKDDVDGEETALNAIVDELEEEMDEDAPEPSAVNMEVAATGKVTARKEDGTRVPTPMAGAPSSRPSASGRFAGLPLPQGTPTPTSSRPLSYAAAIQSVPQDWHMEFSVNDQHIPQDSTIYRAVHFNQTQPGEISARNIWSAIHTIKFKRVPGPPPAESTTLTPSPEMTQPTESGLPHSLDKNPTTSAILRLLSILHELNANLEDVISENKEQIKLMPEPLSQFVNTKLTAKMNRQLEEPLIVASNCLPTWSEDLARLYAFLFPFETRHLFLQSTSFGYSRSMSRWQSAQSTSDTRHDRHRDERPFLGRLQRQKVRISRLQILQSTFKVMELYGSSPSILEVEYFEEVGTGLGPTLEFYSTVSKEFSKKKLKMWRENDSSDQSEFAFGKNGLFPAPMSEEQAQSENGKRILQLFKMLGKFVARSMLDSRIIDVSFNPTFFRIGDSASAVAPSLGAVRSVDNDVANSLKFLKRFATAKKAIDEDGSLTPAQKVQAIQNITVADSRVEDLALDFTLPGYPSIELQPNGSNTPVNIDNVALYIDKVLDYTLGKGVQKQVDAFRAGFSQVFPYSALRAFTPDELVMLFGRVDEDWSLETLMDSIKADHGYNLDSKSVRNLLQVMSELTLPQRRDFLQFVTGSPKLPIGGFKSLTPMFTVVCKPSEPPYTSDDYLPSVMTCVNYLKMPDYSSMEVLRTKLNIAIKEGQGAFHLS